MRYSFHGKVRATGQTVDGFVEAPNSTAAIDRLADRGIIGVYSVRPAPKPPEEEKPAAQLPAPPPPPPPAPVPVKSDSEVVFTTLVDKLGTLLTQVEKLLEKPPQQVIYQTHNSTTVAPAREVSQRFRRPSPNMSSNSTLRDIFQTNLDLRQSLEKLANNGNKAMNDTAKSVADAADRLTQAAVDATANPKDAAVANKDSKQVDEEADAEHHSPNNGRETTAREAKGHGLVTAQPAA